MLSLLYLWQCHLHELKHDEMENTEFNKRLIAAIDALTVRSTRFTTNSDKADELIQETLLKALLCKDSYSTDTNFIGWLTIIMRNSFLNLIKREQRYEFSEEYTNSIESNYNDTSTEYHELLTVVAALPEELNVVFTLYVSGFKYYEIADILKIPLGTVKSRVYAARRCLRHALKDVERS